MSRLGAQFINDWFAPSVRIAHACGSRRFAFGSTIALRREALAAIGGFEAFAATGLPLDLVNTHKHFHLHPTVLPLILSIGRDYGLPRESGAPPLLRPWLALLRRRKR